MQFVIPFLYPARNKSRLNYWTRKVTFPRHVLDLDNSIILSFLLLTHSLNC